MRDYRRRSPLTHDGERGRAVLARLSPPQLLETSSFGYKRVGSLRNVPFDTSIQRSLSPSLSRLQDVHHQKPIDALGDDEAAAIE